MSTISVLNWNLQRYMLCCLTSKVPGRNEGAGWYLWYAPACMHWVVKESDTRQAMLSPLNPCIRYVIPPE